MRNLLRSLSGLVFYLRMGLFSYSIETMVSSSEIIFLMLSSLRVVVTMGSLRLEYFLQRKQLYLLAYWLFSSTFSARHFSCILCPQVVMMSKASSFLRRAYRSVLVNFILHRY